MAIIILSVHTSKQRLREIIYHTFIVVFYFYVLKNELSDYVYCMWRLNLH